MIQRQRQDHQCHQRQLDQEGRAVARPGEELGAGQQPGGAQTGQHEHHEGPERHGHETAEQLSHGRRSLRSGTLAPGRRGGRPADDQQRPQPETRCDQVQRGHPYPERVLRQYRGVARRRPDGDNCHHTEAGLQQCPARPHSAQAGCPQHQRACTHDGQQQGQPHPVGEGQAQVPTERAAAVAAGDQRDRGTRTQEDADVQYHGPNSQGEPGTAAQQAPRWGPGHLAGAQPPDQNEHRPRDEGQAQVPEIPADAAEDLQRAFQRWRAGETDRRHGVTVDDTHPHHHLAGHTVAVGADRHPGEAVHPVGEGRQGELDDGLIGTDGREQQSAGNGLTPRRDHVELHGAGVHGFGEDQREALRRLGGDAAVGGNGVQQPGVRRDRRAAGTDTDRRCQHQCEAEAEPALPPRFAGRPGDHCGRWPSHAGEFTRPRRRLRLRDGHVRPFDVLSSPPAVGADRREMDPDARGMTERQFRECRHVAALS